MHLSPLWSGSKEARKESSEAGPQYFHWTHHSQFRPLGSLLWASNAQVTTRSQPFLCLCVLISGVFSFILCLPAPTNSSSRVTDDYSMQLWSLKFLLPRTCSL